MPTGLTFDEYVDLKLRPPAGADRCFHEAVEGSLGIMFPMPTVVASTHLRSRGYDCRPAMLDLLVENGVVTLAEPDAWTRDDAEDIEQDLHRSRHVGPCGPRVGTSERDTPSAMAAGTAVELAGVSFLYMPGFANGRRTRHQDHPSPRRPGHRLPARSPDGRAGHRRALQARL